MNQKGSSYLDWSIRELHPDADIDQDLRIREFPHYELGGTP